MNAGGSVRSWLENNGFERFVELFEANEIDHEALLELTDEHLKELGLPLGPRVKLLKAVAQLRQSVAPLRLSSGPLPKPRRQRPVGRHIGPFDWKPSAASSR